MKQYHIYRFHPYLDYLLTTLQIISQVLKQNFAAPMNTHTRMRRNKLILRMQLTKEKEVRGIKWKNYYLQNRYTQNKMTVKPT